MLKAHAVAYHIYQNEFKIQQKGFIGVALDSWWYEPSDPNSQEDVQAAQRSLQFRLGLTAHPIVLGDYPEVVKEFVKRKSKEEGRDVSRLPVLDQYWIGKIKGSYDFIGLNHYTTYLVKPADPKGNLSGNPPSWDSDHCTKQTFSPGWPATGAIWQKVVPWGLRKLLCWIKKEYGNPGVMITESGLGAGNEDSLEDTQRVFYYRTYINEVLKAIKIDGCNVTGYFAWSLMDVFEWNSGYTLKFGVHHVDFKDPERKRTPKASAKILAKIFKDNGFPA
jgi:lactase-phlorizin hydrolase